MFKLCLSEEAHGGLETAWLRHELGPVRPAYSTIEADIGCLEVLGQCVDPNPLPEGMEKLGPEIFDIARPVAVVLRKKWFIEKRENSVYISHVYIMY